MKMLSLLLIPCLVWVLAGCGEEEPEYVRPPEYRNSAAEYLLSMQAKEAQARRNADEKLRALRRSERAVEILEIPADFPLAFTTFPGAEWRNGFATAHVTMVTLDVSEAPDDAFERVRKAASIDGWALEVVTEADSGPRAASFQKESRRVELFLTSLPDSNAQVTAMLTELAPPPASPAP